MTGRERGAIQQATGRTLDRPTVADDPAPTPKGAKAALAAALGAVFVGALDLTVIATILPRMVFDLNINTADIDRYIWVVNGYLLAYLIAIPITGRLSDLVGRPLEEVRHAGLHRRLRGRRRLPAAAERARAPATAAQPPRVRRDA